MRALILSLAWWSFAQEDVDHERLKLQEKAESIVEQAQSLEITASEARRMVQLLLVEMKEWADTHELSLIERTRTYASPAKHIDEMLTADRCPLFFEDDLEELCPLDLARSEVWSASVVFCKYRCAP